MKTDNYTLNGLRKLTEKVYDAIALEIGENDAYVFTVTQGTHGAPWMHGLYAGGDGLSVSVSGDGAVNATPDTTPVSLVTKPLDREFRNTVEINVMWVALAGTEVFEYLTQELRDRGVFCRNKTLNDFFGFKLSVS